MSGMPPPGMVYMEPERQHQPQQYGQLRRAGSFNAKMMSQVIFKNGLFILEYIEIEHGTTL